MTTSSRQKKPNPVASAHSVEDSSCYHYEMIGTRKIDVEEESEEVAVVVVPYAVVDPRTVMVCKVINDRRILREPISLTHPQNASS